MTRIGRKAAYIFHLMVTIFCGYYWLIFLWLGTKTPEFVPANISYTHYRTLEYVDPVPFLPNVTKVSTCKKCFNPKSQKTNNYLH